MKNKNNLKWISIQSKVSPNTAARLDRIVAQFGFASRYEVMQYILSAFLKIADPEGEPTEQSKELIEFAKMFEGFENSKTRIITTAPSGNKALKLTDSINIYSMIGRAGYVCKRIEIRGEECTTSGNVDKALSVVLKKLHPRIYKELTTIGETMAEHSMMKILEELIAIAHTPAPEISEDFSELDGSIEYGRVPKRSVERRCQ